MHIANHSPTDVKSKQKAIPLWNLLKHTMKSSIAKLWMMRMSENENREGKASIFISFP